jgi:hypothetical protein
MADGLSQAGGQRRIVTPSYHQLPTGGNASLNPRTTLRNQVRASPSVIASEAKQSRKPRRRCSGLLRFARMTNQSMTEAGILCAV